MYEVNAFEKKSLAMPDSLLVVKPNGITRSKVQTDRKQLIVYIKSTECTACKISSLTKLEDLYDYSQDNGMFDLLVLFCTDSTFIDTVTPLISNASIPFPVYFDVSGYFESQNKLPTDNKYNMFLIDESRKPIYVGNPLASKKLNYLFESVLNNKTK